MPNDIIAELVYYKYSFKWNNLEKNLVVLLFLYPNKEVSFVVATFAEIYSLQK